MFSQGYKPGMEKGQPGSFSVVILAAGGSSRFGQPKQLLPYRGMTLVEHAARTALDSGADEVIVVVGDETVGNRLGALDTRVVFNSDWAEGMGSSIRSGILALKEETGAVVVALCDQPAITADHLRNLGERALAGFSIVASSYGGVIGVPCGFSKEMFPKLAELKGDAGARDLIRAEHSIVTIAFTAASIDIDTLDDYQRLLSQER